MPDTSTDQSDRRCSSWTGWNPSCSGDAQYELKGKLYCVLHFPSSEKSEDFEKVLKQKIEQQDFNFAGAWFPGEVSFFATSFDAYTRFMGAQFQGKADFRSAKFSHPTFFQGAVFNGPVDFQQISIHPEAEITFAGATFATEANFSDSKFCAKSSFVGTTFTEAMFRKVEFDAPTDFNQATFGSEDGKGMADFYSASFAKGVDFSSAKFNTSVDFSEAKFGNAANFDSARFKDADFVSGVFQNNVSFKNSLFTGVALFDSASFHDELTFSSEGFEEDVFPDTARLSLRGAKTAKPEAVSFYNVGLRPHWFVDIDASEFQFTNVEWKFDSVKTEVEALDRSYSTALSHRLMSIACWNLAVNAEENHRYEEASRFRYMAMDARRLKWYAERKLRRFAVLHQLYWLASGYGERILRASVVLLGLWLICAGMYTLVGFSPESKSTNEADVTNSGAVSLDFRRALTYSAGVLTFQKPEPRPATTAAHTVVLLETILGPVQAALLALAIRRKFMR